MLAEAKPVAPGQFRNDEVIQLLQQLVELDPEAAIDFAVKHPELHGQADLAMELFAGWLDRNEMAARDWLGTVSPGDLRVQLVPMVVSRLASELPEEALALAGELPGYDGELETLPPFGDWDQGDELEGRTRERAYAEVFREWAGSDPVAAAARAGALEDPLHRNLALQEVASRWILKDPAAALQWMTELAAGSDRNSALQGIMAEWTVQDPQSSAAFLTTLDESPERNQWLRQLGENWSSSDPKAALAWAAQLPAGVDQTHMVQTVLAKALESGGRDAVEFALTLPSGAARTQGLEMVLASWAAKDAEGFNAWLNGLADDTLRKEARAVLSAE